MRTVLVNKKILTERQILMLDNGRAIRISKIGRVVKDGNQTDVRDGFVRVIVL